MASQTLKGHNENLALLYSYDREVRCASHGRDLDYGSVKMFNTGDRVIIIERGAFENMEGVIMTPPRLTIDGPGYEIDVPEEHQQAIVRIVGGLNVFVHTKNLRPGNV